MEADKSFVGSSPFNAEKTAFPGSLLSLDICKNEAVFSFADF